MSVEALPAIFFNILTAILHGGLIVAGFAILKQIKSWLLVVLLALGMALFSIAMSFAAFLFQGWERASQMIVPGGELFAAIGLPMIFNALISMLIVTSAAYAFFVEPGNRKNV
jgi:hypothetical protein